MLTDPVDALAEQSTVLHALLGLAGLSTLVHDLADDGPHRMDAGEPDDVVHLLLGLASLGDAVRRLGVPVVAPTSPEPPDRDRWLR